jgi:glucokinase
MDLIADIGATNARCALLDDSGRVVSAEVFENRRFAGLEPLLQHYLSLRRATDKPRRAALAVAAPVLADNVEMINNGWRFAQSELKENLGLSQLTVLNDFAALAWALPAFGAADLAQVGSGTAERGSALAVVGPGTGLGVAALVPAPDGWAVVSSEGGHVTLPAFTAEEMRVIDLVRDSTGHCSAERILSGPGLVRLYQALATLAGRDAVDIKPADVTALAAKSEPLARKALAMFFSMLGTVASDVALTVGARGGVFIGGGIVPRMQDDFRASGFRARFIEKGRYRSYLDSIPTYLITDPLPAFRGLRAVLGHR